MKEKIFGKWRNKIWPIHNFELKKILPLFLMKFLISLNYGILNSLKDAIIVTQKKSGAEVIPVLKGWLVLPIALIVTLIYSKLSNIFKRSTLFYGIIATFLIFFLLYGFFLYPHQEILSPHKTSDLISSFIGKNHEHWTAIYRYWMHSLFFVATELWGSVIIFLLFWGFVNQVIKITEAKRFYTIFSAGGNLAAILTGPIVWHYAKKFINNKFDLTLQHLTIYIIVIGLLIMLIYFLYQKYILPKNFYDKKIKEKAEKKTTLSLKEGFKYIAKSKYLKALSLMVICYGLIINLIETTWKANLKLQYPNLADYQSFMATISFFVGITSFIIALFVGSGIIRFFGWKKSASICPIFIGTTGIIFLFLILTQKPLFFLSHLLKISPLLIITLFGAFQNISTKALKYSIFDPTKEMAFIPLDQESKVKGKAAIDIIGSRLGKSGSSWIQIILLDIIGTGSILSITPLLLPIITLAAIYWIFSINRVSKKFEKLSLEKASI
ncbi:MAG: hypothetical protein AMS24_02655 [Chlamydiae bacterium SM23_39]|nr:MAG: hypothetical protein AMS24_02655 [Chlamydiae bacterium SM23_39]